MNEIRTVEKIVEAMLRLHPKARNSDEYLYYTVCNYCLIQHGTSCRKLLLSNALLNRKKYGLPKFETVRRTRQKLQAKYPELSGNDDVNKMRSKQEIEFREYAKE